MRNRWYTPELTQFLSHDLIGFYDSYNLYAYGRFDPVNNSDPFGLTSKNMNRSALGSIGTEGAEKQGPNDYLLREDALRKLYIKAVQSHDERTANEISKKLHPPPLKKFEEKLSSDFDVVSFWKTT